MRVFRRGRRRRWRSGPLTQQGWLLLAASVAFIAAGVFGLSLKDAQAMHPAEQMAKRNWSK